MLVLSPVCGSSLSDRLEMAKKLANAIFYVHLYGERYPSTISLVGFKVIRNADGRTYPVADRRWEANLYRHPRRQGSDSDYYVMQHDIYSLGVCLLEIGIWETFVAYDGPNGAAQPSKALGLAQDRQELQSGVTLKAHLVALSRSRALRANMGTKYSKVVETCLTCLDEDSMHFGDEQAFQDEEGVAVGIRYIETIMGMINAICV
ncbi:hypothetical protein B0T25DRAFT_611647 [Lasiosphaeria hispida]|uniref:Protein kinase domain-containing protein n=1 Tax=Lasiosphaeria hispida TaxID=260671 RepID=A0AAJ0HA31_9PEZI|nr:hypothetical protein B0T25DRAFT_611647 [Lasiosphaeria hispida]